MIWPDKDLRRWAAGGGLEPYDLECINPASVDLRWSGRAKVAIGVTLEMKPIWYDLAEHVTDGSLYLLPGLLYLLDSLEVITMPEDMTANLTLKSTWGRMGLEHLHSGLFDPGFHSATATWEVKVMAPWPILLRAGQRVMQLQMAQMSDWPDASYRVTGRYNRQFGPQEAK